MREPFFREDFDQLHTCLAHFGKDRGAISFMKVAKFIRDNSLDKVSTEGVLWGWHKRYLITHYPAAYEVVCKLAQDNNMMPPPADLPVKGWRPQESQILEAITRVNNDLIPACREDEDTLRELTLVAWDNNYPVQTLDDMQQMVAERHKLLADQLYHLTYEEVLDVWDYCRKEHLPPFPPPAGSI